MVSGRRIVGSMRVRSNAKIDIDKLPLDCSTSYPPPFNKMVEGRARKRLGRAAGLTQFGGGTRPLFRHRHDGRAG
jgi:hypothetical protein